MQNLIFLYLIYGAISFQQIFYIKIFYTGIFHLKLSFSNIRVVPDFLHTGYNSVFQSYIMNNVASNVVITSNPKNMIMSTHVITCSVTVFFFKSLYTFNTTTTLISKMTSRTVATVSVIKFFFTSHK